MNEQELVRYIEEHIKKAKNGDMVIPYNIDCYEFICNNTEYRNTKMKEGWKIIAGSER